ncbi:MAG: FAD/NAD(P)-binding protein [Myxococcota bacterium]
MSVEWLIIGGGIHGVHIAARLVGEAGIDIEAIRIIDPAKRLLARWRACTSTTGMTHLRSPSVHHLDLCPWSLQRFADRRGRSPEMFQSSVERPAITLFNEHCDHVVDSFQLARAHVRARAEACSVDVDEVEVHLTTGGSLTGRNVVLAMGASEQPQWPPWAPRGETRVQHVFALGLDGWPAGMETVVVVGGGISGAQIALRLAGEGHRVHLVSRHRLREHRYDWEPGWLGPRLMDGFRVVRDVGRRRVLIDEGRHPGSVPPYIRTALAEAIAAGAVQWHESDVDALDRGGDSITLRLTTGGSVRAHRVLLATGFTSKRPGGALVDRLAATYGLPFARCGYPVVDTRLRWHPRVYVSGALAELELGPTARNIAGARRTAERLVAAVREGEDIAAYHQNLPELPHASRGPISSSFIQCSTICPPATR